MWCCYDNFGHVCNCDQLWLPFAEKVETVVTTSAIMYILKALTLWCFREHEYQDTERMPLTVHDDNK